jgi:Chaperonin GroEL (HSP60 family)
LDDALSATRSAIEEGILPGGGIALLSASIEFEKCITSGEITFANEDQLQGARILIKSCEAPLSAILSNAGVSFDVVKNEIVTRGEKLFGYNARTGEYVNMIDAGIIDPAKVTRSALENSVSISGLMLTTECTLIEENDTPAEA